MVAAQLRLRNFYIYEDLATFPEDGKRREILDGDLIVNPAPILKHQQVLQNLNRILDAHMQRTGAGNLFFAPVDVRLGDNVFEPDLLVVLKDSRARLTRAFIEGPPDLVVEILSPSTEEWDRGRKSAAYARGGVREYWILDPERRQLEQFTLQEGALVRVGLFGADTLTTALLPGLQVDLSRVWAD
ncbi:MAG: Uma2 family endonuclease [Deltaproteobacteria bacterium]|nr:Uma2 family endonuclease [Deltaproteobacteria bacterium]